jgi:hypothetical protein
MSGMKSTSGMLVRLLEMPRCNHEVKRVRISEGLDA